MPGIFQTLDIARRAIWANRLGVDVASHNIANANTPGYSRQRVNLEAATPIQTVYGQLGLGVKATDIERMRSQLLDRQFRTAQQGLGKNQIKENTLYQVETILQEPSENSIGNLMTEFFSEFSNLGTEPENTTIRNVLVQKAISLSEAFRSRQEGLQGVQKSLRSDLKSTVHQINQISREIADVNRKISAAGNMIGNANDLKDRRDLLLDRLSEYVNIRYTENNNGQLTVSTAGQTLVSGNEYRELTAKTADDNDRIKVSIKGSNNQNLAIGGGKLGGLLQIHNQTIFGIEDQLNKLAKNFIEEVNRLHQSGRGLGSQQSDPPQISTGLNFFDGNDATSIQVTSEIKDNVANIAASLDDSPGNGDVALAIANLRNKKVFGSKTQTFNEYYNNLITNVGSDIQVASTNRQNQEMLTHQIQNQREAESGVSLDEEMTNLIKYQHSLEASARVIKVVDEILETVVNMV